MVKHIVFSPCFTVVVAYDSSLATDTLCSAAIGNDDGTAGVYHNVGRHTVDAETLGSCPCLTLVVREGDHGCEELLVMYAVATDSTEKSSVGKLTNVRLEHFPGSYLSAVKVADTVGNLTYNLPMITAVTAGNTGDGRTNLFSVFVDIGIGVVIEVLTEHYDSAILTNVHTVRCGNGNANSFAPGYTVVITHHNE